MHELRTCDFCGADAVGVFEMLPPAFTPADDQRRIVLCESCRETLTDAVKPLLDRLDADASVDVADDAPAETGANVTTDTGPEGSVGDASATEAVGAEPEPSPSTPDDYDAVDASEDGDRNGDGDGNGDEDEATETEDSTDGETTEADPADSTDEDVLAEDPGETDAEDIGPEPPNFRKVIRILQNREFPVERTEVEALASGAYDLDDEEVADIFDYAIKRGLLEEDGRMLRKA
ncbi:hypothetical protein C453_02042 [Haloferax elongans ATCC BAA-1513]|uniref:Uncharacterized protein n=1 Tax=Haloferax elongans ATCC BAA-1513 TaxID=1230453 RepID=M0HWY1_HALEO|nr:hypothetical protein [Haloferax elongans]ELZ88212.1 hypothetical protein C453_02042 [Haloferax elongans ATCC BAA-1513]